MQIELDKYTTYYQDLFRYHERLYEWSLVTAFDSFIEYLKVVMHKLFDMLSEERTTVC